MTKTPTSRNPVPRPAPAWRERLSTWASDDGTRDEGQGLTVAPATHFSKAPRVYPTRFGAAFLGISLLTLVGCINYQLSLGYLVTFLMLGLWVGGAITAARTLSGLHLQATPPPEAWAGGHVSFTLRLGNPSDTPRWGLRVRTWQPRHAPITFVDVPAQGQGVAQVWVPTPQRGPYALPRLRLEGRDLLGLWRGVTYPLLRGEVLVYPQPEENAPPLPSQSLGEGESGRRQLGQEDYAGIRAYQPGDAPRTIAWRQSARTGELQTKVFDAPAALKLRLNYGQLQGLGTEERLSRLTAWVVQARQQGAPFRLELPQQEALEGTGEAHIRRSLGALARYQLPSNSSGQNSPSGSNSKDNSQP